MQSSGGVAIAVGHHLTADTLHEDIVKASRARICARVVVLGSQPVCIISAYLVTNIGLTGDNRELISQLVQFVHQVGMPWLIAGDFNMEPATLQEAGVTALEG